MPLYEHYLFTGDQAYLARIYPLMKGAAQFFLDSLVEEPRRTSGAYRDHRLNESVRSPSFMYKQSYFESPQEEGHEAIFHRTYLIW